MFEEPSKDKHEGSTGRNSGRQGVVGAKMVERSSNQIMLVLEKSIPP